MAFGSSRSCIHLRFVQSFRWSLRKGPHGHIPKTLYSHLQGDHAPWALGHVLKSIASWLILCFTCASKFMNNAGDYEPKLPTNQSYLLHTQISDLWNIWVTVSKVKYFTVSLYIYTVLLSYCLFLSFFFIFTIFVSDKNIHLRVSWFVITTLTWIHMITEVYVMDDTVLKYA